MELVRVVSSEAKDVDGRTVIVDQYDPPVWLCVEPSYNQVRYGPASERVCRAIQAVRPSLRLMGPLSHITWRIR
jgi:hypothetical protein